MDGMDHCCVTLNNMPVIFIGGRRDGNGGTIGKLNAKGIDRDRPLSAKGGRLGQE